jgi:hypothetical protein
MRLEDAEERRTRLEDAEEGTGRQFLDGVVVVLEDWEPTSKPHLRRKCGSPPTKKPLHGPRWPALSTCSRP